VVFPAIAVTLLWARLSGAFAARPKVAAQVKRCALTARHSSSGSARDTSQRPAQLPGRGTRGARDALQKALWRFREYSCVRCSVS
jgi:hypothetical protein